MHARRRLTILPLLVLFLMPCLPAPAAAADAKPTRAERKAEKEAIAKLPQKYRDWLQTVDLLITDQEVATFAGLDKDYERDAFIKRFWAARNPYHSGSRNLVQERWEQRIELARTLFGSLTDDRARVLLLN